MPNRSLDDFAGGGEEETEADASDAGTAEADAAVEEAESESVAAESAPETAGTDDETDDETDDSADEPTLTVEEATPTYDFSPDGSTCEACGETVETRWHADEVGMVCADCKGWD